MKTKITLKIKIACLMVVLALLSQTWIMGTESNWPNWRGKSENGSTSIGSYAAKFDNEKMLIGKPSCRPRVARHQSYGRIRSSSQVRMAKKTRWYHSTGMAKKNGRLMLVVSEPVSTETAPVVIHRPLPTVNYCSHISRVATSPASR